MVNQPPEGFGEQQWYPQLPEGYTAQNSSMHDGMLAQGSGQNMPRHGFPQGPGFPGQSMPGHGFPQGPGFPGQGMPGHGFPQGPGFPGQGMPGHGFPQGPGFPGQGMPGHGFPPGPGFPGQGPPGRPPGGQQGGQAPSSPPPNYTPTYPSTQTFAVDPGAIRGCLFRFTYVWLSRREAFWFFPTFVGRTSVAGYRWRSRQRRWEYFGIDLNNIDRFTCF